MTDECSPMSPVTRRLLTVNEGEPDELFYLNATMWETSMPYRREAGSRLQYVNGRY